MSKQHDRRKTKKDIYERIEGLCTSDVSAEIGLGFAIQDAIEEWFKKNRDPDPTGEDLAEEIGDLALSRTTPVFDLKKDGTPMLRLEWHDECITEETHHFDVELQEAFRNYLGDWVEPHPRSFRKLCRAWIAFFEKMDAEHGGD